jgi:hypothetical protein
MGLGRPQEAVRNPKTAADAPGLIIGVVRISPSGGCFAAARTVYLACIILGL